MSHTQTHQTKQPRLLVSIQSKGSTGKSTVMAALTRWLIEEPHSNKIAVAVFDVDRQSRTLEKIFGHQGSEPLTEPHTFRSVTSVGTMQSQVAEMLSKMSSTVAIIDGAPCDVQTIHSWHSRRPQAAHLHS